MAAILFPPQIKPVDGPLVFLAGPIQGAPDWQSEAIRWFQEHAPNWNVASPRRQYPPDKFEYAAQVDWETHYLRRAAANGAILFWLPPPVVEVKGRSYAQTTRFELAEWKVRHERDGVNLVVGLDDAFTGARYIRHRFGQDCPRVPIVPTLEEACQAAVEMTIAD